MKCIDKFMIGIACVLSLATSTVGEVIRLVPGTYQVNADCPGSERSGQLQVNYDGMNDGTKFGFPSNKIEYHSDDGIALFPTGLVTKEVGSNHKVYVTGETRRCRGLTWDKSDSSLLFICEENGEVVCTIYLDRGDQATSSAQSSAAST